MTGPPTINKRAWLFGGLAVAPGAALVRKTRSDERRPRAVAAKPPVTLVGSHTASAVEPTLTKVLQDQGRSLMRVPLFQLIKSQRPVGFIVMMDLPLDVVVAASSELTAPTTRLVVVPMLSAWPVTPQSASVLAKNRVSVVPVRRMPLQRTSAGQLTAAGYAALAGAIWTYVR